jgi:hypothetical protein
VLVLVLQYKCERFVVSRPGYKIGAQCERAGPNKVDGWGGFTIALKPGKHSTEIRTSAPEVRYRLRATYVNRTPTESAVNENGDTYGAPSDRGEPDMREDP